MYLLDYKQARYVSLPSPGDDDGDIDDAEEGYQARRAKASRTARYFPLMFVGMFCFAIGFLGGEFIQDKGLMARLDQHHVSKCQSPSIRREWRSLGFDEKQDYIRAVRCLLSKPSKARSEGLLYEDFPRLHHIVGGDSHNTALFLPWHRYLLHVYETELKDTCGYNGSLTYWDWSLDWEALADSPVFDNVSGFGGDGDSTAGESVGNGYCVTDDGNVKGRLAGDMVRPAVIEEVLRQPEYANFFMKLEKGPHNQIPNGIRGDFFKFTAPNDPLFYLHHRYATRSTSQ
ncbi:hypothetical protein CcaCcLH18_10650 [Colletotrichum camelliae]|nr:hypothetical protein CcaCcLH18_10650 [Colletotrichum camelliae]